MTTITVVVQYVGHVINAGGTVSFRTITLELTEEQKGKLKLGKDEYLSVLAINNEEFE